MYAVASESSAMKAGWMSEPITDMGTLDEVLLQYKFNADLLDD